MGQQVMLFRVALKSGYIGTKFAEKGFPSVKLNAVCLFRFMFILSKLTNVVVLCELC